MTRKQIPSKKGDNCFALATKQKKIVTRCDTDYSKASSASLEYSGDQEIYLTNLQVRNRYQIGQSTLYRWMSCPNVGFPEPVRLGPRCVRWALRDLQLWEAQRV